MAGKVVPFSVRMKSRSSMELQNMHHFDLPCIRLQPLTPQVVADLGLPAGSTWAWAIVQPRKGQPDALLYGGTADSMSGAEAQAREEFKKREEQWARKRAALTVPQGRKLVTS
jgi:hypothetical protein